MAKGNGKSVENSAANVVDEAVATVREAVDSLRKHRDSLMTRREEIQNQLNEQIQQIDAQIDQADETIANIGGEQPRRRGRPRGSANRNTASKGERASRPQNEQNLPDAMKALLEKEGPLSVPEVVTKVQEPPINYKTSSANFDSIVRQVFTNFGASFKRDGEIRPEAKNGQPPMFVRLSRGLYDIVRDGDNEEKVAARAEKFAKNTSNAA